MIKFIAATHNRKKLAELLRILEPMGFEVISPGEIPSGIPEPEETGTDFEENALIKAESACKFTGLPAIADDSGLCVDVLDGAPGVYSARFAGTGNDEDNNDLLLKKLEGVPAEKRTAHYVSSIAVVFPDGRKFTVRGECYGRIGLSREGNGGFGYDPLFISEIGCFGTASPEQKDAVSHRAKSLALFAKEIKKYI